MAEKNKGDKFPLLVYRRWARMLRMPSLLIAVASAIIWWFAPNDPSLDELSWVFIVIGGIGALIFIYSLWTRQAAYVQCFPNYLRIRTPFFVVAVSYRRILQVRPTDYHSQLPLSSMKLTQKRLLSPFLGRTVILLELKGFPVSERRLHRWLPWFMFAKEVSGFIFVVEDWMKLSRQISVFSDRWITQRQERPPIIGRTY